MRVDAAVGADHEDAPTVIDDDGGRRGAAGRAGIAVRGAGNFSRRHGVSEGDRGPMKSVRSLAMTALLSAALLVGSSCAPRPAPSARAPSAASNAAASLAPAPLESAATPRTPRPPPPAISTPMQGEPTAASLTEARLLTSSCADNRQRTEARVARMRADVDAEFQSWVKAQPGCWADYRRRAAEEREAARGIMGFGRLGLSGIGEGGGGIG